MCAPTLAAELRVGSHPGLRSQPASLGDFVAFIDCLKLFLDGFCPKRQAGRVEQPGLRSQPVLACAILRWLPAKAIAIAGSRGPRGQAGRVEQPELRSQPVLTCAILRWLPAKAIAIAGSRGPRGQAGRVEQPGL